MHNMKLTMWSFSADWDAFAFPISPPNVVFTVSCLLGSKSPSVPFGAKTKKVHTVNMQQNVKLLRGQSFSVCLTV